MNRSEINAIGQGFADCTLPAAAFTHQAHWAAVLWLLDRMPPQQVAQDMPGMICRFNTANGGKNTDTEGYHETITLASIGAAAAVMPQQVEDAFASLMQSGFGASDWLLRHWTKPRLFSVPARRGWVAPDVAQLPFGVFHRLAVA